MNLLTLLAANDQTFFLPKQGSNLAIDVDWAWNIILVVTGIFFFIVIGAMTLFVFKYRRRTPNDATSEITHNTPLEIVWTVVPLILVIMFFFVGFKGFLNYDTPPSNCSVIDVEGKKWSFQFTYANGAQSFNELWVEKDQPVRLNLHSTDVLHAFYIPTFRVQRNLIPYRQTTIWFIPTILSPVPNPSKNDPGGFDAFCTQYCGDGHSKMGARVHVLEHAEFIAKMNELANPFKKKENGKNLFVPYVDLGKHLYDTMGCATCHTITGPKSTGPTWKGLWNSDVKLANGTTVKADAPYVIRSFLQPSADVVDGFAPMPVSFEGTLSGSASASEKGRAIVEYIKSLGNDPYKPAANPQDNPDLYDVDHTTLRDKDGNAVHPESDEGQKLLHPAQTQN